MTVFSISLWWFPTDAVSVEYTLLISHLSAKRPGKEKHMCLGFLSHSVSLKHLCWEAPDFSWPSTEHALTSCHGGVCLPEAGKPVAPLPVPLSFSFLEWYHLRGRDLLNCQPEEEYTNKANRCVLAEGSTV